MSKITGRKLDLVQLFIAMNVSCLLLLFGLFIEQFFFHFNLFHIKGIGTVIGAYDRFDIMGFGYEITQEPMTFVVTDIQAESQVPYL